MHTNLTWQKGLLSTNYNIFSGNELIGHLQNNSFSQVSTGQLRGKSYTFRTLGFLNKTTEILDNQNNKVIGKITYSNWMTKANITILSQTLNWKYENLWNTKWCIMDTGGTRINYSGTSTGGKVNSNTDNDIYLLSGLFVTNYYWQMSIIIMVAAFVPIFVSVLS
jgi:hypothetical protein